jgi:hypothetical protein
MVWSPGKVFETFDEVIIPRWLAFIKDPMQRCPGFWHHAFPIGIWLIIWQFAVGIQARIYARMEDYPILLALLSALFECLTIMKNTSAEAIPLGLVPMIQESLPPELLQIYIHMFHYLEMCALLVARVTQKIPTRDRARGIIRGWPGMILLHKAIEAIEWHCRPLPMGKSHTEPIRLLPTYEYFESKVLAVWSIAADITDGSFRPQSKKTHNRELAKMYERCQNESVEQRITSITDAFRRQLDECKEEGDLQGIPIDVAQLSKWAKTSIDSIGFMVKSLQSPEKKEIELEVQNTSFPLLVFSDVGERKKESAEFDGVVALCDEPDEKE